MNNKYIILLKSVIIQKNRLIKRCCRRWVTKNPTITKDGDRVKDRARAGARARSGARPGAAGDRARTRTNQKPLMPRLPRPPSTTPLRHS